MKFIYVKKDSRYAVANLSVNNLLEEIQENDLERCYLAETAIKLNRFLCEADPNISILLFVKWDKVAVSLDYLQYDKKEDEHTYMTPPYFEISSEEIEQLFDAIS